MFHRLSWAVLLAIATAACGPGTEDPDPGATEPTPPITGPTTGSSPSEPCPEPVLAYPDGDGDGHGDADATATEACELPAGHALVADDCDDRDARVYPGAVEVCDGVDNDCDALTDDDDPQLVLATGRAWFADADGDGYGAGPSVAACLAPPDRVAGDGDCDDASAEVHPGAVEVCNGIDDDCDGTADGPNARDATTWYTDADGDGYGLAAAPVTACTAPPGAVARPLDCDDARSEVHPGAPELCNGEDDDCDGAVDEAPSDPLAWYADTDGDGFGDPSTPTLACQAPPAHVAVGSDCDDLDGAVSPGAAETCNGVDDDCDGSVDEDASDAVAWYADLDLDGYGDMATITLGCALPPGAPTIGGDCDDGDPSVSPAAVEVCDGRDNDCDGVTDGATASGASTWYRDEDRDGFGVDLDAVVACEAPAGFTAAAGDCDDGAPGVHPDATETCDPVDHDCDGSVDEGASDATAWYADLDGDGIGGGAPVLACAAVPGHVLSGDDCDDGDPDRHPGALEQCDGVDSDCDGSEDRDIVTFEASDGTLSRLYPSRSAALPGDLVLADAGTVTFCDGEWYTGIEITAPVDLTLRSLNGGSSAILRMDGQRGIVHSGDDGGALPQAHTLTVEGLTIEEPYGAGGAIASLNGNLALSGATVIASQAGGGFADIGAHYGTTTVVDSRVRDATGSWAAIGSPYGTVTVQDSIVEGTAGTVVRTGEAAYSSAEALLERTFVHDCGTALNATAGPISVTDSEIALCGVGLPIDGSVATVTGSVFREIETAAVDLLGGGQLTVVASTFQDADIDSGDATISIDGSAFVRSRVDATRSTLDAVASTFEQELALVLADGTVATLTDCTVADAIDGAILGYAGASATLDGCTLVDNESGGLYYEGAIEWTDGQLYVTGSTFVGSRVLLGGGSGSAVYLERSVGTFVDSAFTDNVNDGGGGGGIAAFASTVTVDGTTFEDNGAGFGGGLYLDGASTGSCVGDPVGFAGFHGNEAAYGGGAVFLASSGTFTATTCDFGTELDGTDNLPFDIEHGYHHTFGDDASFVCASEVCQ